MCIICNLPQEVGGLADRFLNRFSRSRLAMAEAADLMLECSRVAVAPEDRARYDATHKSMVRLIRDWNRLEQERESHRA